MSELDRAAMDFARKHSGLNSPKDARFGRYYRSFLAGAAWQWERDAKIAKEGCLVPPDGGSPTNDEVAFCEHIAKAILSTAFDDSAASEVLKPTNVSSSEKP